MELIRVSPDQMDGAAARMDGQINEWDAQVANVKNCITELDSMWEGLGNQTFNNIWQEHAQQFVRLKQLMMEYQAAIKAAAAKFRAADQNVSSIVGRR